MSHQSRNTFPVASGSSRGSSPGQWAALLLLVCYLPGCSGWQARSEPIPLVLADHPGTIQVTLRDGSEFELKQPVIRGDTLGALASADLAGLPGLALVYPQALHTGNEVPRSIPLADLHHIALARFSAGKTLGAIVGVGLGLVVGEVAMATACRQPGSCNWGISPPL